MMPALASSQALPCTWNSCGFYSYVWNILPNGQESLENKGTFPEEYGTLEIVNVAI
jgi:hypothetical protein